MGILMKLFHLYGNDKVQLLEPTILTHRDHIAVIPEGFVFNGANIPMWAWSLIGLHPLHHKVIRAALFHDYMYGKGYKLIGDSGFKAMLKEDGCNRWQYMLCYWAVRLFGRRNVNI